MAREPVRRAQEPVRTVREVIPTLQESLRRTRDLPAERRELPGCIEESFRISPEMVRSVPEKVWLRRRGFLPACLPACLRKRHANPIIVAQYFSRTVSPTYNSNNVATDTEAALFCPYKDFARGAALTSGAACGEVEPT